MSAESAPPAPPRDAGTLVLLRAGASPEGPPRVLMGQRGGGASFMPNKFVFPGGGVEAGDHALAPRRALSDACAARLAKEAAPGIGHATALSAIRETFEETGLRVAGALSPDAPAPDPAMGESWAAFMKDGAEPALDALRFIFRAVTPPHLPKRFDARFFLAGADDVLGDPDDFSGASGELSRLAWVPLSEARRLELPFITAIVLAEIDALTKTRGAAARPSPDRPVPHFAHDGRGSHMLPL